MYSFFRLLRTFVLWIEETRLHDPNVYLSALPSQYDSNLLRRVLSGETVSAAILQKA
jgi:hypothetical protein